MPFILRGRRPLETQHIEVSGDGTVVAPTPEETLRIKAYLLVKRNQTRDYIDVAALTDRFGIPWATATLANIDEYYNQGTPGEDVVAAQLLRQLGKPRPQDSATTGNLDQYKELVPKWQTWAAIVQQCLSIADAILSQE